MNSSESKKDIRKCSIGTLFILADTEDKIMIFVGLVASVLNGAIYPVFSLLFGDMTNTFSPLNSDDEKLNEALKVMIKFIVVGCIGFFLSFVQFACLSISSTKQTAKFRLNYFQNLLKQDIKWHDRMNCNELNSKLSNDSLQFQNAVGEKFGRLVLSIFQFAGGIGLGFYKGWQMSVVLTAALPFIGFGTIMMFKSISGGTDQIKVSNSKGGAIVEEYTANIKTVKALTGENFVIKIFNETVLKAQIDIFKSFLMMGLGLGFLYLFLFLDYSLCFWYGAKLVADKTINDRTNQVYNLGDVMTIFFAVMIGGFGLGQTSPSIKAMTEGRISMQNYQDIQNQQIDIILDDHTKLTEFKIQGTIELKDVSFNYPSRDDIKVLDRCSVKFLKNKKNALVGESGQGKSTIMQLIERYYDPYEGEILIDGRNIKDYNLKCLRQQIGYIEQEPVLFNTTIKQNLLYANPNATETEMIESLKLANAWSFIESTPDKLNTNMGSQGSQFSGGQKQRIAIARALLKKPNILLLDEATSALDKQNERGIQETIDQIAKSQDITVIVIAHRLSSIVNSEKIFVIDHGKLVQEGNHEELMAQIGKYRSLVALQAANMLDINDKTDNQEEANDIQFQEIQEIEPQISRKVSKRKSSDLKQPLLGKESSNPQENKQSVLSNVDYNKLDKKQQAEVKKQMQKRLGEFKAQNSSGMLKVVFLIAMLCSLVFGILQPFAGKLLSSFMGKLSDPYGKDFKDKTDTIACFMVGLAFMVYLTQGLGFYLHSRAGQTLSDQLRIQAFDKLIQQRLQYYENKSNSPGQLSSTISSDCQQINQLISVVNGVVLSAAFSYITGLILAFLASWQVTLIALGTSPLIMIAALANSRIVTASTKKNEEKFKEAGLIINDTFSNIRTVLSFSNTQFIYELYAQKIKEPLEECKSSGTKAGAAYGFGQLANFLMYAIIFYTGSLLFVNNKVTVDEMFSALFCVIFAASAVGNAGIYIPEYGKMINSAQSIFRIIDQPYEQIELNDKNQEIKVDDQIEYPNIKGDIEFVNVTFKYPSRNQYVLKDFSLKIESGQSIGLVGPSGCGKSTIISLLLRFYEIESGQILLDGKDIRQYDLKSLRQLYGVVNQEPVLFSGNVKFNIVFNTADKQEGDIEQACKDANAYNFIMNDDFENTKPDIKQNNSDDNKGFNRQVGNKGIQISGGQKQRLAIARAILKQPKILLLDEATSALDHQNEQLVQQSLDRVMENRTSIMIAHRMSTVVNCDNIYVVSEGKIVEQGNYQELINKQGYFWKFQQGVL